MIAIVYKVRVSHADMDMERALKLSRDAAQVKEETKKTSPETIRKKDDDDIKIVNGVARPKFAHVGPVVRGEKKNLIRYLKISKLLFSQERRKERNCTGLTVLSVRSIISKSWRKDSQRYVDILPDFSYLIFDKFLLP